MNNALQYTLKVALEALEGAEGNINPERGYAKELEDEIAAAIKLVKSALNNKGDKCVNLPIEPPIELLTTMSAALGLDILGDGSDGTYPITGPQSTVRQCYDALVSAIKQ